MRSRKERRTSAVNQVSQKKTKRGKNMERELVETAWGGGGDKSLEKKK